MSTDGLRDFLEIPYEKLEELNLQAKDQRLQRVPAHTAESPARQSAKTLGAGRLAISSRFTEPSSDRRARPPMSDEFPDPSHTSPESAGAIASTDAEGRPSAVPKKRTPPLARRATVSLSNPAPGIGTIPIQVTPFASTVSTGATV